MTGLRRRRRVTEDPIWIAEQHLSNAECRGGACPVNISEFRNVSMNSLSDKVAGWTAFGLMSFSLWAAVLLRGGVYPEQWAWSAMGVSVAALLAATSRRTEEYPLREDGSRWLMAALLAWMVLALLPLPPALIAILSAQRREAISTARDFTRQNPHAWLALSVAPGATMERLLDVVPAMAAFLVARGLCARWRSKAWVLVIPVVAVAWLESVLGLVQFRAMRAGGGETNVVTGTYVNRDHFAGLLEMAFPLAVLGAVALWRKSKVQPVRSVRPALAAIGVLSVGGCLLMGIGFSLSRMGFIATLGATATITGTLLVSRTRRSVARSRWRWVAAAALPVFLFVFLPSGELLDRFGALTVGNSGASDPRAGIWGDTFRLIAAYKWVGCGLGAYEYAFYRFNTNSPMDTIDFAHNDYLQIAAELGLIGAALAAALALWIVWRLLSVVLWMRASQNWELAVGLLGALFAIGVHSLADFNLYIPANALTLAWLSGMADSPGLRER
jgi:putative inorganic carbon (hco3(-)) transporter